MKNLFFLYLSENSTHAFDRVFSGESAFTRSLLWAQKSSLLPVNASDSCGIVVACSEKDREFVKEAVSAFEKEVQYPSSNIKIVFQSSWTWSTLLSEICKVASETNAENVLFSFADRPFLDEELTGEIIDSHKKYVSEYTFADGYPLGFAPEMINVGTLKILYSLSEKNRELGEKQVQSCFIFDLIKSDINSFEIESVIAPKDFRMLRLDFSCGTKRNLVACCNLYEAALKGGVSFTAQKLSELAESSSDVQRTLPSFYNVQISYNLKAHPFYSPYPASFKEKYGVFPFESENPSPSNMTLEVFKDLLDNVVSFSEDAVIGLSAWGEPLLRSDFPDFVEAVLLHKGLSVLIETDGTLVTEELAEKISTIVDKSSKVLSQTSCSSSSFMPEGKVTWIISIDSASENMYEKVFSGGNFQAAVNAVSILSKYFQGSVYPQFTRMNDNEDELETFYRFWHAKDSPSNGNVIIQKYDDFCKMLPSRKPADLSPLKRNVCWHLKRDMTILGDGSVPLCREHLFSSLGNVFEEGIENIWKKTSNIVEEQLKQNYSDKCKDCDEYYTFNF